MVEYLNRRIVLRKKLLGTNTWESEDNGIILENASDPAVSLNLGKSRDTFKFKVFSPNSNLFQYYFDGDGVTTAFTLKYSPIPSEQLSGDRQKFYVYVDDVLQVYTTDYSVSGSTLTFVSAPISGNQNIKIVYPTVEADDLVDIYIWSNAEFSSLTQTQKDAARRIEGTITEPSLDRGTNNISVRGYGLIDIIFSGMAFALDPDADRAHTVIQNIISQLNQFNPNRKIYGQDSTEWTDIGNDTTSEDITYTGKYRTGIEMIEELSSNKNTGNGQYVYFLRYNTRASTTTSTTANKLVDSSASFVSTLVGKTVYNLTDGTEATINAVDSSTQLSISSDIMVSGEEYSIPSYDFHWKSKSDTDSLGSLTEGVEPSSIKAAKAIDGVINVVIFNAGLSPNGMGIEDINYDFNLTGFGSRWKYVSETSHIGSDLLNQEMADNPSDWDTTSEGNRKSSFPNGYPYTCAIEARDSTGQKTGSKAVAADADEFDDIVIEEMRIQGKIATQSLIEQFSNPRFKCTKFIPYSEASAYELGGVYTLDIPSFGLNEKKMRLMNIDYEFWGVQLQFEEDEKLILEEAS